MTVHPSNADATDVVRTLAARLGAWGLNLLGATSVAAYDRAVPPSSRVAPLAPRGRGIVVAGHGGDGFWRAYRSFCREHPDHTAAPDPVDRFTRAVVLDAAADLAHERILFPFDYPAVPVSFQHLGEAAGLGARSLLGVLVHPVYGPWIALRAAIVVAADVVAPRPADGFDPCPACTERPCIAACPVGAVGDGGWDVPRCAAHRLAATGNCAAGCTARIECVYGRAHRYSADALAYHQAAARREMAAYSSAAKKD